MKKNLLMQYTVLSTYSDLKMHVAILYNALNKLINKLYL